MNVKRIISLAAAIMLVAVAAPAQEVKEKTPRYTYVATFSYPRAHWGEEVEKQNAADRKIYDAAMADGTLVAYGVDEAMVHSADGYTHDTFFAANSLAGLMKVLSQFTKARATDTALLASATKHEDLIFVSRFYNGRPGSWKDVYTYVQVFTLKADAPDDAVQNVSKNLIVPLMEKLLADGTILQYEIDTEAIHKNSPDDFYVFYIAPNAESLDKARAAQADTIRSNVLGIQAFGSMTEGAKHRDDLWLTSATYK